MTYLKKIIQDSNNPEYTKIPTVWIENLKIKDFEKNVSAPLATYEKPLWHSVARGAYVSGLTQGIEVFIKDDKMTRSVIFESEKIEDLIKISQEISDNINDLKKVTKTTSKFAELLNINTQIVGNLLYVRFEFFTGDASGHNMTTKASQTLMNHLLKKYKTLKYVSISGNYCTDKKVSCVNGILGRGKYCIGKIIISSAICKKHLNCIPQEIVNLNTKKNLIGSILAGSIRSANAHFANMLLAFYLATGQDAANIIEGSQGITFAEEKNGDLHFSVTLPNVIIGTVGNGKDLPQIQENLKKLGCADSKLKPGKNALKLAKIITSIVLCGELSLLAAQCNPGELVDSHMKIERK